MDAEVEADIENNMLSDDEEASPAIDAEIPFKGGAAGASQENIATPNINGNAVQATPDTSEGESQWYVTKT